MSNLIQLTATCKLLSVKGTSLSFSLYCRSSSITLNFLSFSFQTSPIDFLSLLQNIVLIMSFLFLPLLLLFYSLIVNSLHQWIIRSSPMSLLLEENITLLSRNCHLSFLLRSFESQWNIKLLFTFSHARCYLLIFKLICSCSTLYLN